MNMKVQRKRMGMNDNIIDGLKLIAAGILIVLLAPLSALQDFIFPE